MVRRRPREVVESKLVKVGTSHPDEATCEKRCEGSDIPAIIILPPAKEGGRGEGVCV